MFQCLILLLLGYVVTRAWLWYRNALILKAKLRPIDVEEDNTLIQPSNDQDVGTPLDSTDASPSNRVTSSRQANAQMRKRVRKERPDSSNETGKVAAKLQETDQPSHQDLEQETKLDCLLDGDRLRSGRKRKESTGKKSNNAVRQQDAPAPSSTAGLPDSSETMLPMPTPEIRSSCDGGDVVEAIEVDASRGALLENHTTDNDTPADCGSFALGNEEHDLPRDVECEILTEIATPEEENHCSTIEQMCEEEEGDKADCGDVYEPQPEISLEESDMSDTVLQTQPMQQYQDPVVSQEPSWEQQQASMMTCSSTPLCHVNWDLIESDSDDESDAVVQCSPASGNAPILWCSAPPSPMHADSGAMMGQVGGWIPVTMPIECAPTGTLDGRWMNLDGEKILIERLEIMFESGVIWNMQMHSPTQISIEIEGAKFDAELDEDGEHLIWSDGDIWDFHGRVEDAAQPQASDEASQAQWCQPQFGEPTQVEADSLQPSWTCQEFTLQAPMQDMADGMVWEVMPGMQMISDGFLIPPMEVLADPPAMSLNQMMPAEAQQWEICWDWKKKGCCPRGVSCDWYHPELAPMSQCQPCDFPSFF
jgi:hypothetical protein